MPVSGGDAARGVAHVAVRAIGRDTGVVKPRRERVSALMQREALQSGQLLRRPLRVSGNRRAPWVCPPR